MKWIELAASGDVPQARSSHSLTAIGDTLYLWGGEHAPRVPLGGDLYAYSLAQQTWRKVAVQGEPPSLRNAHAAAALGSDLYIFGGRSGIDIGEGSLNDLWRFDTTAATWQQVHPAAGSPLPLRRSYHRLEAAGGKLYMFGGCGEGCTGRLADLWEFDPAALTWRQLQSSDAIKGRGGAGFAATPGALWVIAGFTGQEMNDVHRFDLATDTWDCPRCCSHGGDASVAARDGDGAATGGAAAAAPACGHGDAVELPARSVCAVAAHGCSACVHANHVVVFGGEVDPSTLGHAGAGAYDNDCYCLDTACQHWHRMAPAGSPPAPRGWLAAAACSRGIVIHGGNGISNERLGDMWLLEMHD